MKRQARDFLLSLCFLTVSASTFSADVSGLPEDAPTDIKTFSPRFDFDGDGCLPTAIISSSAELNGGLSPTGSITGQCRDSDQLAKANTLARKMCKVSSGVEYCGYMYELYFEKDQWGI